MNFFEDFSIGQRFAHATPRTLTAGDASLYIALTGARQPLPCSLPLARAMGYPAAPLDDLLVFHVAFGKTVPDISYNAVANLGYADLRFLAPVYAGDTLSCESEVIGLRANSNGKSGIVYVRSRALNQEGHEVLSWARWVMVARRTASRPLGLCRHPPVAGARGTRTHERSIISRRLLPRAWRLRRHSPLGRLRSRRDDRPPRAARRWKRPST